MSDQMKREQQDVVSHYAGIQYEVDRIFGGTGPLEFARTKEIIERFLPDSPARILDVGGGAGPYSCWLAREGYEVHLLDLVPLHVEQARAASGKQPDHPVASFEVGDACRLNHPDNSFDAVLLLGPLYHLTSHDDRLAALREARRVVKPGGVVIAACISMFASTLDGLKCGYLADPVFAEIAARDRLDGQHRNPTPNPEYFTTAFFHNPSEIEVEIEMAELTPLETIAVEGPAWLLGDFAARWDDTVNREHLLSAIRSIETEPSLLGASAHLLAIARKEI